MWTVSARIAPQSVTRRFAILGGEKLTEEQEEQGTPFVGSAGSVVVPISLIIHSPEVRRGPRVDPAFPDFTENLFSTSSAWSIDPACNHSRVTCSSHPRDRSFDYVNFILEFSAWFDDPACHHPCATYSSTRRVISSCCLARIWHRRRMRVTSRRHEFLHEAHLFETLVAFGRDFRQLRKTASNAAIEVEQGRRPSP